jgi:hypothetical protein
MIFEILEWILTENLYVHWLETVFAVWMHAVFVLAVIELSILFSKLDKMTRSNRLQKFQGLFVLVHFLIVLPIYGAPVIAAIQPTDSLQVVERVLKANQWLHYGLATFAPICVIWTTYFMTTLMRKVNGSFQTGADFSSKHVYWMRRGALVLGVSGWIAVGLRLSFQQLLLPFANQITRIRILILVYLFRSSQYITNTQNFLYSSKISPMTMVDHDRLIQTTKEISQSQAS